MGGSVWTFKESYAIMNARGEEKAPQPKAIADFVKNASLENENE